MTANVGDPRPRWIEGAMPGVLGSRCVRDHVTAEIVDRCPACAGSVDPALFAPRGVVWSWTVVRLEEPAYGLAYVDLQEGPRVVARFAPEFGVVTGDEVSLVPDDTGNLAVEAHT